MRETLLVGLVLLSCGPTESVTSEVPGPEDCANQRDDNQDGKVDCADPLCFSNAACRYVDGSGGSAGGSAGGAAGGSAGGSAGGAAGGSAGGSAGGAAGGSAGGSAGGAAGGSAGGAASSPCTLALSNPNSATDQQLWACAVAPSQLSHCFVSQCTTGCACAAYVRSTELCTASSCTAPLTGTGCSDSTYYSSSPFSCTGDKVKQSACMLRYLITAGFCS